MDDTSNCSWRSESRALQPLPTHHSVAGRAALDGGQECNVGHRGVHVFIHVRACGLYVLRPELLDTALKISFNHNNMAVQLIDTAYKMASPSILRILRKGRALVFGMIHVQALPGDPLDTAYVHM